MEQWRKTLSKDNQIMLSKERMRRLLSLCVCVCFCALVCRCACVCVCGFFWVFSPECCGPLCGGKNKKLDCELSLSHKKRKSLNLQFHAASPCLWFLRPYTADKIPTSNTQPALILLSGDRRRCRCFREMFPFTSLQYHPEHAQGRTSKVTQTQLEHAENGA